MSSRAPTPRTRVRRLPELGVYERERVHAILDEALYCHLAWVDDGDLRVIPTIHARVGDTLYVHGSAASSTLRAIKRGQPAAIADDRRRHPLRALDVRALDELPHRGGVRDRRGGHRPR